MCNLYAMKKSQEELRALRQALQDRTGNLPPLPGIYPDQIAPVIRNHGRAEEMVMLRWGFPPPPNVGGRPITNVRNTASNFWLRWLRKPEHRCLVPATSFCEWTDSAPKTTKWFALADDRPLFYFAGIWCEWTGTRGTKKDPVEGKHLLYSFLTTDANDDVAPIHAKAMPVILRDPDEADAWLQAPWDDAMTLQRPLPPGSLKIVASGPKTDDSRLGSPLFVV
jgi:putative SOS response-associated peptidase YedK